MPADKMTQPIRQPRGPDTTGCAGFVAFQKPEQCSQTPTPPPAPSSTPVNSYCLSSSGASTPPSVSSTASQGMQTMTWLSVYGHRKPFYQSIRFEESRYASRFLAAAGRYDPISPGYRHAHCEVWLNDVLNSLLTGWQFPLREVAKPTQRPVPPPPPNTPEPAWSRQSTSYARNAAAEPEPPRLAFPVPTKPRQPKRDTPTEQTKPTRLTRPTPRLPLMAPPAPFEPRPHRRDKRQGHAAPSSSSKPVLSVTPVSYPRHRNRPALKPALWVPDTHPRARRPRKRVRILEPDSSPEPAPPRPRMAWPGPQARPAPAPAPARDPVVFIEGRPLTLLMRRRAE